MNQAQLNAMVEQATEQEKRQQKAWQNWWLGGKLIKRQARARHRIEAGEQDEQEDSIDKKPICNS